MKMLRFRRRCFSALAILAVLCGFQAERSRASQAPTSLAPDQKVYSFIRSFLLAAYPDLPVSMCRWQVTISAPMEDMLGASGGDVGVTVIGPEYTPTGNNNLSNIEFHPLLSARFLINNSGVMTQANIQGYWTNYDQWLDTYNLVNAHPEWSDAEIVRVVMKAGAKYGPDQKNALLSKIPMRALGQVLGVKLSLQSLEFRASHGTRVGSFAFLEWVAIFRGHSDGKVERYAANFEPFGGRLTLLLH